MINVVTMNYPKATLYNAPIIYSVLVLFLTNFYKNLPRISISILYACTMKDIMKEINNKDN